MPRKARITVPGAIHHVMARGLEKVTIEDVAREVCRRYKVTHEVMKKRGKQNAASEARKAFASECSRHYQFPMRAIACYLGISPQAVANMLKRNEKTGIQ